ncbi:MAG: glycoside hydrolase family 13 protein [Ignavibacteriaceae bacterium]|nr:glycoside hydrolase family 13 protein [Ignavibacteriaceae bacterium]
MKKLYESIFIIVYFIIPLYSQNSLPEWSKGIVWYQIFPERFANGDTCNDPQADKVFTSNKRIPSNWKVSKWTSNWFAREEWEKESNDNFRNSVLNRRYGGDIQGIINHLDYLKTLGIGGIYLNPVFDAVSLHKYDGSTFHHIDINFGPRPIYDQKLIRLEKSDNPSSWSWTSADSIFLQLIREVHNRGMKIIIDGVFNHTGTQFWAFQDIIKNGEKSEYKDWYLVKSFDDLTTPQNEFDYKGWWGSKYLPEFNRTEDDLHIGPKKYIFNSTKRWMDPNNDGDPADGIDGWRLDVAREVPIGFWNDWRQLVKSLNNEAIIVGELWELSPDFISENGAFDALMNYNFAFAVNDFFIADDSQITVSSFIEKLKQIDMAYPEDHLHVLQNLIDSHDTDRLLSMIINPDRNFDRDANEENPNYSPAKPDAAAYEKQKLIAVFQMTYRGAPMIYYGTEVGMWGADDPHDRKPMVWDDLKYDDEIVSKESGFSKGFGKFSVEQNKDILNYYTKLIQLRNDNPCLKIGTCDFLYSNDDKKSFVFQRKEKDNWIITAFNLGCETDSISIYLNERSISIEEILSGETGTLNSSNKSGLNFNINIPAGSALVYKVKSEL